MDTHTLMPGGASIGKYVVGLDAVYLANPGHELYRRWVSGDIAGPLVIVVGDLDMKSGAATTGSFEGSAAAAERWEVLDAES